MTVGGKMMEGGWSELGEWINVCGWINEGVRNESVGCVSG